MYKHFPSSELDVIWSAPIPYCLNWLEIYLQVTKPIIIPINSTVNIWTYKFIFKYLNQHHHSDPTWNIDWGSLGHSRQRLVIPRSPYFEGLALKVDSIKSHGLCRLINRTELSGKKTSLLGFFLASNYR